jgi:hypothetical protein
MEPQEPRPPGSEQRREGDEALRRLEERLGRASAAAERLIAEATGSVRAGVAGSEQPTEGSSGSVGGAPAGDPPGSAGDDAPAGDPPGSAGDDAPAGDPPGSAGHDPPTVRTPPPSGWQIPRSEEERRRDGDLQVLMQVMHALRDLIPPDLQRRLAEALRELMLAIRALIDWYLESSKQRRPAGSEVQDIPIM